MSAATMQNTPVIPPRPSRSQERSKAESLAPAVPPRPVNRRLNRSVSPNPDRFAPSPFSDGLAASKTASQTAGLDNGYLGAGLSRTSSVDLPGPGEEGLEYAAAMGDVVSTSPEQTRIVGEDIKLHAPKPTMPSQSATNRVATVTRTDSDRAASFGIGRPRSTEQQMPSHPLRKKASTASQLSQGSHLEDEQGIPHIGQHVPMYPNAGDVQAPSPAPPASSTEDQGRPARHHTRKRSSRGFNELPPGSYGLHGHGVLPTDKLERAYYEKHPELAQKEHFKYQDDRPTNFAMSSVELNKIVHDTSGTMNRYVGTPSEQVGFEATDEYVSRVGSPRRRSSATPREGHANSPLKSVAAEQGASADVAVTDGVDDVIHVNESDRHRGFAKFGNSESAVGDGPDHHHGTPILASDEVAKDQYLYAQGAAVEPPPERSGSAFEMDQPKSRPNSRPASVYSQPPVELRSTPLDDVKEYEPLFPEDEKTGDKSLSPERLKEIRARFPSRDIWEDAPTSVHVTAEVSTPDLMDTQSNIPRREGETPAQAFARRQEELAEQEGRTPDGFLWRRQKAPATSPGYHDRSDVAHLWHQQKPAAEAPPTSFTGMERPDMSQRFPSRDIWEDTPDSLQFTTTVSGPQTADDADPSEELSQQPTASVPAIPTRPRKQGSSDDTASRPNVPERPKPKVPVRPSPSTAEPSDREASSKSKPTIPPRPGGNKIAALQAGFMSDLNKRLQLGPQAHKRDESPDAEVTENKEKTPLPDARKGRARGPQRRAPTKSVGPANPTSGPPPASHGKPTLTFSMTTTLWSIDEEGTMTVVDSDEVGEGEGAGIQDIVEPDAVSTEEEPRQGLGDTPMAGSNDESLAHTQATEDTTPATDESFKQSAPEVTPEEAIESKTE